MEKVCYILGAGFSRPLGLPLMSDFLSKAKDMYFAKPEQYSHFESIFSLFHDFAKIHNYAYSDQFNIEELLSLAEMRDYVQGTRTAAKVRKFIIDVISFYTPKNATIEDNRLWLQYLPFVATLLGLSESAPNKTYSVVTLNYDRIIEYSEELLSNAYLKDSAGERITRKKKNLKISKLHGCVERGNIVPPTWNKGKRDDVRADWEQAHLSISEANHIRILGYSLPATDSYITYLIKVGILNMPHLKSLDVICLDGTGETKQRYDQFIKYRDYHYYNFKLERYLECFATTKNFIGPHRTPSIGSIQDGHTAAVFKHK